MSETTYLKLFKHDNPSTNENQFDVDKSLNDNWDKLDDFAGNVNEKVQEIEGNIAEQGQDIAYVKEELETEINELQKDIQANSIIEETEQAKSLYIDDATDSRGKITVEGNVEQDGEPSIDNPSLIKSLGSNKNLFNINGTRAEQSTGECSYSDGKITITKAGPIRIIADDLKTGKSYILSWGNGNINSIQTVYTSSNTNIGRNYNMNSSTKFIASESSITISILNTAVGQYIENLKLEEGETATTYSPYRAG